MTRLDITSEFSTFQSPEGDDIDFDNIISLKSEGTTCDTFLLTLRQKRYFVKRLKPDLRDKGLNLTAMRKEFEIGSSLHHSSIPTYRWLGKDYLVTDYIEGHTLARMMKEGDPWLQDQRNVDNLFRSLLDVTGYLHSLGIVHCDIKADNIIVSSSTRNVMLVDFDKCHTSVMHSTSGNPGLYGVDKNETGSRTIDIRGLGMLAQQLRDTVPHFPKRHYRNFIKTALREDTDISRLSRTLDKKDRTPIAVATLAVLIGFIIIWIFNIDSRNPEREQIVVSNSGADAQQKMSPEASTKDGLTPEQEISASGTEIIVPKGEGQSPSAIPQIKTSESQTKTPESGKTSLPEHEVIIRNQFGEMNTYLLIGDNALASSSQLQESALKENADLINRRFDEIYKATLKTLQTKYPDRNSAQINEMITASPYYKEIKQKTDRILNALRAPQ